MTQGKKKISKSQEIRYQWLRQRIEAGELDTGASYAIAAEPNRVRPNVAVTYPRIITEVRPEREQTRVRISAAGNRVAYNEGTVVSPVLYSLAYRKAWKKIADEFNNRA